MPLRSLILDHFWLKLFSLILAMVIWLALRDKLSSASTELVRTFLNRPILVLTDSAEHPAVLVNPDFATVTVRGPVSLMQFIKDEDIHVFVRLGERRQLSGELPVHVLVPAGASVALITPTTAAVKPASPP